MRRILGTDRGLEWHRAVAPGVEVGEITAQGLALSRLKHGFESRGEGPKEVRSSLRRQSFSGDSKREVIAPALGRTRRGFTPATRQLREAESRMRGAGEGEGIAHRLVKDRRPFFRWVAPITDHPFLTRKAWRVGYHVLEIGVSVHAVVLRLPDNGRNLVAPGCEALQIGRAHV